MLYLNMPDDVTQKLSKYLEKLRLKLKLHTSRLDFQLLFVALIIGPSFLLIKQNLINNPNFIPFHIKTRTIYFFRILAINAITATYSASFIYAGLLIFNLIYIAIFFKPLIKAKNIQGSYLASFLILLIVLNIYSFVAINKLW